MSEVQPRTSLTAISMELIMTWHSLLWSTILLASLLLLLCLSLFRSRMHRRPPGPRGWPIVGNMFDVGTIPHRTLFELRSKYGSVLWLKLGCINVMVVQSAKAAAELFKNHDHAFCDRACPDTLTAHDYYLGSLAFAPYGANWRMLRRLCASELLVTKRVNDAVPLRRKCVDDMVRQIKEESAAAIARGEYGEVTLAPFLFAMAFNMMSNLTVSRDLLDSHSDEKGHEFYDAMCNVMGGMLPNVADFFPWLKWLDPQGLRKKMLRNMGQAVRIVGDLVNERIQERQNSVGNNQKVKKDFLNALLEYEGDGKEGPRKISTHMIIIIIVEMFFAGTETTSSTLEWTMTELLCNPEVMRKAKEEIDQVVGRERKVEESDMDQLPYLQAVFMEVLRLHPTVPLLIPRSTLEDTKFMEYSIPKNTQIFVNAWGIARDPDSWKDPLSFKPERFLESNIDYKGQNYEFIPFGSGRRMCVGMLLAHKVNFLALGSLIHCFDWEFGRGLTSETMDMSESMGITAKKYEPLKVIPKFRSV